MLPIRGLAAPCHSQDVQARRDIVRGNLAMEQTEMFHFISAQPLMTSKHDRLHSSKTTTAGTCIGPMPLPQWRDNIETWHLTFKEKKAIYGDARMLPHCRPDYDQDLVGTGASRVMQVRKDSDSEPVTYNALHRNVIEELTHQIGGRGKVRAIVDLTPHGAHDCHDGDGMADPVPWSLLQREAQGTDQEEAGRDGLPCDADPEIVAVRCGPGSADHHQEASGFKSLYWHHKDPHT